MRNLRRPQQTATELDITSFMNLMIVLVPVLLLNMVFTQLSIVPLRLPEAAAAAAQQPPAKRLELVVRADRFELNYPAGVPLRQFPLVDGKPDFAGLANFLKDLKQTLQSKQLDQREITLLLESGISYQHLVTTMDNVRSFKTVVAASVVDAELFPEVALGDAPPRRDGPAASTGVAP